MDRTYRTRAQAGALAGRVPSAATYPDRVVRSITGTRVPASSAIAPLRRSAALAAAGSIPFAVLDGTAA